MPEQVTSDTQRRVKFCLFAAVLNFLILALPRLEGIAFYSLVSLGVMLNALVIWLILKGVKPLMDESDHLKAIAFAKRWIAVLVGLLTIIAFVVALNGVIEKQVIPFLLFGYIFLLLIPMKIFDLAVEKRIRGMRDDS